jgi:hypothetical protein
MIQKGMANNLKKEKSFVILLFGDAAKNEPNFTANAARRVYNSAHVLGLLRIGCCCCRRKLPSKNLG